MTNISDYVVYVDESGDSNLVNIDVDFPIFGLVFCVILRSDYENKIIPSFRRFKDVYWGRDDIILHENEIRKSKNDFSFLMVDIVHRNQFMSDLDYLVRASPFHVIASVIHKTRLRERYTSPDDPYELAFRFCIERLLRFLGERGQQGNRIDIIFERRGKREDNSLELKFRRICEENEQWGWKKDVDFTQIEFVSSFRDKSENLIGLQLADLIVRPITIKTLRPTQKNRAYDIVLPKLYELKQFP